MGDAEFPGDGEGMHALPDGATLAPDARFVIARNGAAFRTRWGRPPDAQIQATDPDIPVLARRTDLASGSLALNDSGDEVLLLTPAGLLADAVAYANGDYAALGLSGDLRPPSDAGLHRVTNGPDFPAQPDGRHRYLFAPPDPFAPLPTPAASPHTSPMLDDNLRAVWGSLAARSNFSPDGTAPPGYLLAAAYAQGLDFVAFADPILEKTGTERAEFLSFSPRSEGSVVVEAWGWGESPGAAAVVYAAPQRANLDPAGLLAHVRDRGRDPMAHRRPARRSRGRRHPRRRCGRVRGVDGLGPAVGGVRRGVAARGQQQPGPARRGGPGAPFQRAWPSPRRTRPASSTPWPPAGAG